MKTTSAHYPKSAHFIGLCGKAMSAVAKILKDHGCIVTGSDSGVYPPISDVLARYEIPCIEGHAASNIPDGVEWIIIGKHAKLVPESNEEVAAAFACGAQVLSFPEVLQIVAKDIPNHLVVVGSYGKSTSTALTTWVLQSAGKQPSYIIGADAKNFVDAGQVHASDTIVFEGDEYPSANWDGTSKFMYYDATSILFLAAEHDHVNVFPTLESFHAPFQGLFAQLPAGKTVVYAANAPYTQLLVNGAPHVRAVGYGLAPGEHIQWWADQIQQTENGYSFDLMHQGEVVARVAFPMLGRHNIENAVGVAAWLLEEKLVTPEEFQVGMASFLGVEGRLERLTPESSLPIYKDFGSSYAKARAGIETMLEHAGELKLTVLFEPHTFSFRNRATLHWYDTLFSGVHRVVIANPPSHGAGTHEQVSLSEIVAQVQASGVDAVGCETKEAILAHLEDLKTGQDILVLETSGGMMGVIPELVARYS